MGQEFTQTVHEDGNGVKVVAIGQTRSNTTEWITPIAFWELDTSTGLYMPPGTSSNPKVPRVDLKSALPAGTNNIGDVDIASALPAGTNLIGSVKLSDGTDVLLIDANGKIGAVPYNSSGTEIFTSDNPGKVDVKSALPAGTNNIGDVDVASLPSNTVAGASSLPAGSNIIGQVKLTDGTDALLIDSNGNLGIVPYNSSGMELFTSTTPGKVDVQNALPAGDNNIGNVDVASLPSGTVAGSSSLPAGTNTIGNVKVTDGTNTLSIDSDGNAKVALSGRYEGLSTDEKPELGATDRASFFEWDTLKLYYWDGSAWQEASV